MTISTTPLWTVQAEFTSREDAVAFQQLARELGYVSQLNSRSINKPNENPVRTWRSGKLALASMEHGRSYDLDHFRAAFQAAGYEADSASPVLSRLVTQGDVVRVQEGTYQLAPEPAYVPEPCLADGKPVSECSGVDCRKHGRCCWQ